MSYNAVINEKKDLNLGKPEVRDELPYSILRYPKEKHATHKILRKRSLAYP